MAKVFHSNRPPIGPLKAFLSGFLSFVLMMMVAAISGSPGRGLSIPLACIAMAMLGRYQWPTLPTTKLRAWFLGGFGLPASTLLYRSVEAAANGIDAASAVWSATLAILPLVSLLLTWHICVRVLGIPAPELGPDVCTSCGYSLVGNESGICPECGISTS